MKTLRLALTDAEAGHEVLRSRSVCLVQTAIAGHYASCLSPIIAKSTSKQSSTHKSALLLPLLFKVSIYTLSSPKDSILCAHRRNVSVVGYQI